MAPLTALTTTIAGKIAAALTGVVAIGGGLAVATDMTSAVPITPEQAEAGIAEAPERVAAAAERRELPETTEVELSEHVAEVRIAEGAPSRSGEVHDALHGDAAPGDEGFGQQVAARARAGGRDFGADVAAAARSGAGGEPLTQKPAAPAEQGLDRAEQAPAVPAAPVVPTVPTELAAPADRPADPLDTAVEQPAVDLPVEAAVAGERSGR